MQTQTQVDNIAIARRFVEQVLGKNDRVTADEIVDPNITYHTGFVQQPLHGREAFKQAIDGLHKSFPDVNLAIEDAFASADGERVVIRFHAPATHRGELLGVPATG